MELAAFGKPEIFCIQRPWEFEKNNMNQNSPGDSSLDLLIPVRWRSRFSIDFGSRELTIPKRSPAELPGFSKIIVKKVGWNWWNKSQLSNSRRPAVRQFNQLAGFFEKSTSLNHSNPTSGEHEATPLNACDRRISLKRRRASLNPFCWPWEARVTPIGLRSATRPYLTHDVAR